MPRLSPHLIRHAFRQHPLLAALLRQCRTLESARNELRWIKEHVDDRLPLRTNNVTLERQELLHNLCRQRARGVPLQYILGTEFFGDLELIVRPGVFIPRPETAVAVQHLCDRLKSDGRLTGLRPTVLDLCTGSGCIAHLISHELARSVVSSDVRDVEVLGVDASQTAVDLARENGTKTEACADSGRVPSTWGISRGPRFMLGDLFSKNDGTKFAAPPLSTVLEDYGRSNWDIIVCNPPYISAKCYLLETERSARTYEPKLALVPSPTLSRNGDKHPEDVFYSRVLELADTTRTRLLWFEVGDYSQGVRVLEGAHSRGWSTLELWRDDPLAGPGSVEKHLPDGSRFLDFGTGHGRSVFLLRDLDTPS